MAGFYGIFGETNGIYMSNLSSTVDLEEKNQHRSFSGNDFHFEVAFRDNEPLKGNRFYEDDRFIMLFHGDFVDYDEIPWEDIKEGLREDDYLIIKRLSGIFSFFWYDKLRKRMKLVSDRRGQDPLYYTLRNNSLIFSTDLSTFCRAFDADFNKYWLYEYYFFDYSVSKNTPVTGVSRLGYAQVLSFSGNNINIERYVDIYRPEEELMSGEESLESAYKVFKDRVPEYYRGSDNIASALTAGWDARTSLAFAPDLDKVLAYTYGIPGNTDQAVASRFARKNDIRHKLIYFDDSFVRKLPEYMLNSVYFSSGLNHVGRSSLYYTYYKLCQEDRISLLISGIQYDQIFRGHAHPPPGMMKVFNGRNGWMEGYGFMDQYEFRNHINKSIAGLKDTFGPPESNKFQLLYHLYITGANLFAGEIKIADQFCTLRVPAWDNEILALAFGIEESTLTFSQFGDHKRGDWPEMLLQAYLLTKVRNGFGKTPVGSISPRWASKGKAAYVVTAIINKIFNRLRFILSGRKRAPLENNRKWIKEIHRDFIERLVLSEDSMVRRNFDERYFKEMIESSETHYSMKIATAELLARLISNKWNIDLLRDDLLR